MKKIYPFFFDLSGKEFHHYAFLRGLLLLLIWCGSIGVMQAQTSCTDLVLQGSTSPGCGFNDGSIQFSSTTQLTASSYRIYYKKNNVQANSLVYPEAGTGLITIPNLGAGKYTDFYITVSGGSNGCTIRYNYEVELVGVPHTLTIETIKHPNCGFNNGSITLTTTVPDGYRYLFYKKNNQEANSYLNIQSGQVNLTGLGAGTYTDFRFSITGCEVKDNSSQALTAIPYTLTVGEVTHPSFCDKYDGDITFTTTIPDGQRSFEYKINGNTRSTLVDIKDNTFSLSRCGEGVYSDFSISYPYNTNCKAISNTQTILKSPIEASFKAGEVIPPSLCGAKDGKITFTTNFPDDRYNIRYNKEGTSYTLSQNVTVSSGVFSLTELGEGVYSNFHHEGISCDVSDNVTKIVPIGAALSITPGTVTPATTCASQDGKIEFTTTVPDRTNYMVAYKRDGVEQIAYGISVTSGTFTLGSLRPGKHSDFTITIPNINCTAAYSGEVIITGAPLDLKATDVVHPTLCSANDGRINFTTNMPFSGGISIRYKKNGTMVNGTLQVDPGTGSAYLTEGQGTYSDFTYNFTGCPVTDPTEKILTAQAEDNLKITSAQKPSACYATDGSITFETSLAPNNENGSYRYNVTYKKNGVGTTRTIFVTSSDRIFTLPGLGEGVYSDFSITNTASNCTATDPTETVLISDTGIELKAGETTQPSSCLASDGSITFTTTYPGGSISLSYKKNGTEITNRGIFVSSGKFTLTGLSSGTYSDFSMTIIENGAAGCSTTENTVKELASAASGTFLIAGAITQPTTCNATNGSIAFTTDLPDGTLTLLFKRNNSTSELSKSVTVSSGKFSLTGLNIGTYSGFNISGETCSLSDPVEKILASDVSDTFAPESLTHPSNCSSMDGSITFTTTLADGFYTLWYYKGSTYTYGSFNVKDGEFTLTNLGVGSYSGFNINSSGDCKITLTDATVQSLTSTVGIPLVAGVIENPLSCGSSNGSIRFNTSYHSNLTNYTLTYKKDGSSRSAGVIVFPGNDYFTLSGLGVGTYSDFSMSSEGCEIKDASTKVLSSIVPMNLKAGNAVNPASCDANNGSIAFTVVLSNGTYTLEYKKDGEPASRSISVSAQAFTLTGLEAGVYSDFTITSNGCTTTDVGPKTLVPNVGSSVAGAITHPTTCAGLDGSIAFTSTLPALAAGYDLKYTRNGVGSTRKIYVENGTFVLTGLSVGTYSDFVIAGQECAGADTAEKILVSQEEITLTEAVIKNIAVCGGTDGSITFKTNLNPGTYPLTYEKDGTEVTSSATVANGELKLTGLTKGKYTAFQLTVSNCIVTFDDVLTLTEPSPSVITAGQLKHPSTCGGTNGSIAFTATDLVDGTYAFKYLKDGTQVSANVSVSNGAFSLANLGKGVYTAFALTLNACTAEKDTTLTLTEPPLPQITAGKVSHPTVCGTLTGSIAFTTNLDNGGYALKYKKDGKDTTSNINVVNKAFTLTSLGKGKYSDFSLTVNNCSATASAVLTLEGPGALTLTPGTITRPSECGVNNGSIAFSTDLPAGNYTLNFRKNGKDTSATVSVNGSNAFTLSGIGGGDYSGFEISNAAGCTGKAGTTLTVTCPVAPVITAGAVTHPTLCQGTDGRIAFTTTLPDGSYDLNYKKNGTDATARVVVSKEAFTLGSLSAGTYTGFSITHENRTLVAAGQRVLSDPTEFILTAGTRTNPTVCGKADGSIAFTTNLPAGKYTLNFKRSGKDTTAAITVDKGGFTVSGLRAGTYSGLSITSGGCEYELDEPLTLTDPGTTLTVKQITHPTACGQRNGKVDFTTNLANGTYTLNYTSTAGEQLATVTVSGGAFTLTGLRSGDYTGLRIAAGGCAYTLDGTVTLTDPGTTLTVKKITHPAVCGQSNGKVELTTNLANGTYTLNYTLGKEALSATVTVSGGAFTLSGLRSGDYSGLRLTNGECVYTLDGTVTLTDPGTSLALKEKKDPSACGLGDAAITLTTTLPNGSYSLTFKKDNKDTSATVTVAGGAFMVSGLYEAAYSGFSITSGSCDYTSEGSIVLTNPAALLTLKEKTDPTVCGQNNGAISLNTNLSDGSYSLVFKKGSKDTSAAIVISKGAFTVSGLAAGAYSAFDITARGCHYAHADAVTLASPNALLTAGKVTGTSACGKNDGSIAFTTNLPDGSQVLNFIKGSKDTSATVQISNGSFILSGLAADTYSSFSISAAGCVYSSAGTLTLTNPAAVLTVKERTNPTTCGVDDGTITLAAALADGNYTLTYKFEGTAKNLSVSIENGSFKLSKLAGGSYTDFRIVSGGCEYLLAEPVTIINPVAPGGTITASGPTELCEDDEVTLTAAEGASYLWSNGKTTRSITVSEAGTYKVKVTSAQGCESNAEIKVEKKICNLPPVAVCKPLVVIVANPNDCYSVVTTKDLDAGSYDPNGDWTRHTLLNTDGIFRPGTYTVTYEVMDPKGAFSTCQSEVRILDHTPPVARARDLNLELDANGQASITIADVDAGSYDNCGPVTLSLNRTTFDCSDLGNLQVRLTVTDASGNVSEALSDITISDNTPPVVQANNVTLTLDENGRAAVSTESLSSGISDNCGIWSISADKTEFTCTDIGENDVTLRVEDVRGNVTEAKIKVTVLDDTAPELVTSDVTLYLDANGKASLTPQQASAGSKDNCAITSLALDREEFSCQDAGEHEVTLTAKDAAGNISTATFKVTVRDTIAPKAIAKNLTVVLDESGFGRISAAQADNGSTDNCEIVSLTLSLEEFGCQQTGTHQVTLTATDAAGNTGSATFTVTVEDKTAPVVLTRNAVMELDWDGKATLATGDIDEGSTDNCGIQSLQLSQTEFSCTDLGRRIVRLTATDASGNTTTETSVVTIKDPNGVCPCSYGVLAFDGIKLKDNEVSAGGVGVINSGKKVKLRNTVINKEGTFVKAPQNNFDRESESTIYIRGAAPSPEAFKAHSGGKGKKESVKKGESKMLSGNRFNKVKIGKDATVTFNGGDVYIRKISAKKNAKLVFSDATTLLVKKGIRTGKGTEINTASEQVRVYAGGGITIGNGSEVNGYLHTREKLKTRNGGNTTSLEGLFVARKIRGGKNTQWSGGGVLCTGTNEPEPVATKKDTKRNRVKSESPAAAADSTLQIRVNVSPNPAAYRIRIEAESETEGGDLLLTDLKGNVMFRKAYTGKAVVQEVNIEKYAPGIYILKVSSGGKSATTRIVKE